MGQAAEVYAEELSSLRFGHPLWFPEEQVQIGDGALLSLNRPAESQNINRSSKFRDFVARNHRTWYDYVTSELDIECRPEELVCISGWIKTSEWTVAAFTKESNSHDCTIQGQIGSVGGIGCGLHITHSKGMTPIQRSGPKCVKGRSKAPVVSDGGVLASENDQTIFVQFYQVKYRRFLWPKTMRAAAGPDTLPEADGEEDGSTLVTVGREDTYGSDIYDACGPRDEVRFCFLTISYVADPTSQFKTALNPLLDYLLEAWTGSLEAAFILPSEPPDRNLGSHWDIDPTRMPTLRAPNSQVSYPYGVDTLPAVKAIPQLSYAPSKELVIGPSHIEEDVCSDVDVDGRMELTTDELDTTRHRPSPSSKKKALLIGIEYSTCRDRDMKLTDTVRDAEQLKQHLMCEYTPSKFDLS
ncbi:hypothetical protein EIP86_008830 [Pleurotus ostreatoroseus]|nr:hypothetical protein EIP86_008830 [Pleurotus ostreatoroseus]